MHAEGYPSGEMKHGPIALADPELFTIALLPEHLHYEKSKSNVEELSARDSTICAISSLEFDKADDFIRISKCRDYMLRIFRDDGCCSTTLFRDFCSSWEMMLICQEILQKVLRLNKNT